MPDSFADRGDAADLPARRAEAVAPSDAAALPNLPKALYVGTGGTLVLRAAESGGDVTLKNVAAGQIIPIRAAFVRATGTTAADIVALL